MGTFTVGQVVLVPFPFSNLTQTKIRPAVVLAYTGRDDWILCQITSNPYGDPNSIMITDEDFQEGSLHVTSYGRPGKLFTANDSLISGQAGMLKIAILNKLIDQLIALLKSGK